MTSVSKLIIGVTAGAILGILYAPEKGSLTRRKLSRTGNKLRERLSNIKSAINDKIESLKEDVEDIAYHETVISENETTVKPHSWQQ
jgi:gas vesicle protein